MSDVVVERLIGDVEVLRRRVAQLERQEYVGRAGVAEEWVHPGANATDGTQRTVTTSGSYVAWPNSAAQMSITLPVSGYIWYSYSWSARGSAVRTAAAAFDVFIGSSQQGDLALMGQPVANTWQHQGLGPLRSPVVVAGTYVIDLKCYMYNADTVTMRYLHGSCFWTRAA